MYVFLLKGKEDNQFAFFFNWTKKTSMRQLQKTWDCCKKRVTLHPRLLWSLGTIQECVDLGRGPGKFLWLGGSAGLTLNQFSPWAGPQVQSHPCCLLFCPPFNHFNSPELSSSRTRKEKPANSGARLTTWFLKRMRWSLIENNELFISLSVKREGWTRWPLRSLTSSNILIIQIC